MDMNNKIREKDKVVQPSNMNSNRFISYWRLVLYKRFSELEKKSPTLVILRNNYKPKPKRDGRRLPPKFNRKQLRFMVPPSVPPNKQWHRVEHQKFP